MHIDKQKDHGKSPQGSTADNAITGVLGQKQRAVFKGNKTEGGLRRVAEGKSIIISRDQSFYAERSLYEPDSNHLLEVIIQ
jgi:hypothetical protein